MQIDVAKRKNGGSHCWAFTHDVGRRSLKRKKGEILEQGIVQGRVKECGKKKFSAYCARRMGGKVKGNGR